MRIISLYEFMNEYTCAFNNFSLIVIGLCGHIHLYSLVSRGILYFV